jgi:hypothetical protein
VLEARESRKPCLLIATVAFCARPPLRGNQNLQRAVAGHVAGTQTVLVRSDVRGTPLTAGCRVQKYGPEVLTLMRRERNGYLWMFMAGCDGSGGR